MRPYALLEQHAAQMRQPWAGIDWRLIDAETYLLVQGQQPNERQAPRHGTQTGTIVSYYSSGSHGVWTVRRYTSCVDDALCLCEEAGQPPADILAHALADAEFGDAFDPNLPFRAQLARRVVIALLETLATEAREAARAKVTRTARA